MGIGYTLKRLALGIVLIGFAARGGVAVIRLATPPTGAAPSNWTPVLPRC
ncbi:MAG: hypothetical protein Q7J98_09430 [Kiritimatiellia bacterium]|nr:hypothetical protein [Kiritimatiellia bacterium]